MRKLFLFIVFFILPLFPLSAWAVYDVPSDRQTTWVTGTDLWNGGDTPSWSNCTTSACNTLWSATGDITSELVSAISSAPSQSVVRINSGTFTISGTIYLKDSTIIRGLGPSSTILNFSSGKFGATGGGHTPSLSYGNHVSGYDLDGSPTKGDTTLDLANSGDASAGNWIAVYQNNDSAVPVTNTCGWCGENSSYHQMQQIVKVTGKTNDVIDISRPLYFTFKTALDPEFKKITWSVEKAGIEDLRINNTGNTGNYMIDFYYALYSWVKNVETYNASSGSSQGHIRLWRSYGCEIRDSYVHHGRSHASGANYGIMVQQVNSDHKIENNIGQANRHSLIFEGGGTGSAVLYNYWDDNWESSSTDFLTGDMGSNHGEHPYMILYEGNIAGKFRADVTWGSSSHGLVFRNWFRGDRDDDLTPANMGWGAWAIDTQEDNNYYSFVGNVVGESTWGSGTVLADGNCSPSTPNAFRFGCTGNPGSYGSSKAYSSAILHGNYDYITDGVALWQGGSDHDLKDSYYYASKPSWWDDQGAGRPWPSIGPDVNGYVIDIPAKDRYEGETYNSSGAPPLPPKNLSIVSP